MWLGADHRVGGDGPPIIFETLIFGGPDDGEMERYCTEAEALVGHEHWVARERRFRSRWQAWRANHLDDRRQVCVGVAAIAAGVAGGFLAGGYSWWFVPLSFVGGLLAGGAAYRLWVSRRPI